MCEVGVVHHDQRGLPSKLKGHSLWIVVVEKLSKVSFYFALFNHLQVGGASRLLDDMANFSGACEGHLICTCWYISHLFTQFQVVPMKATWNIKYNRIGGIDHSCFRRFSK